MNTDKQPQEIDNSQTNKNSNRMFIYGLSLLLIIALPIMVYKLAHDWRKLQTVRAELITVKNQANDLAILQKRINLYKDYHNELKQLMENANQSKLGKGFWIERQVAINKRQINRSEASAFLTGSGRTTDAFFKTAMFDLHTVQLGDDLFKFRQGDANDVQMTLDGTFYTKIKQ